MSAASWGDASKPMTDDEIKQAVIQQSIAGYPGHCPCPYNLASNGSNCGKRSAWSKPDVYAPICYQNEVAPEMMRQWEQQHGYTSELNGLQKIN
jgi:hypothetical protein